MKKLSLWLTLGAAVVLVGGGCSQAPGPDGVGDNQVKNNAADTSPIKLGYVGPLTGEAASLGNDGLAAAKIAVDEVNKAGGVNGRMLELVAEDGQCNPKVATNAGNKLINVDKVPAIVGGLCSGETMAIAPMAEQNKVIMVSTCSSAPTVTAAGDYIFRTYPSDAFQGKYAADYVYTTMGKKKAAVMNPQGDYGVGIKNSFEARFKELGGEIVLSEEHATDNRDFRTTLTKIKASGAEVVYFPGYPEAVVAGAKQAKELNLGIPLFGADAWDDAKVTGNAVTNGYMYTVASSDIKDENWVNKLKAVGANNTVCAPRAYDNVKILADVMKRVGTDTTKMKDELYKVKDYAGVGGSVSFDSNGDMTTANYVVKLVKGGKAEAVK